ncbi:hypothetical protein [Variovorax guangxiensis]|uniref:hypothetical protein n=1 Tax=Variovorax guangxiensis TaxID=1775474 RepID=UPI0028640BAB|nr:hypothetical protein [Variovorax guangxiensis]MDR6856293.1 hypothetical protein [Variovorax guangxiensis]
MRLLLLYMLKVIEQLGISFGSPSCDPIFIVKGLLVEKCSEADRRSALTHWWSIVDERGVRDFQGRDVLVARLAVCLLSPNEESTSEFGEQLSWFLEVLGFLGEDVDKAINVIEQHFDFVQG